MSLGDLQRLIGLPVWEWPPEAADRIEEAFGDLDAVARLVALELAPWVADDAMVRGMLALLSTDAERPVRAEAARSLGRVLNTDAEADEDDAPTWLSLPVRVEIERALKRAYHDASNPDMVRQLALEASLRRPQPWHPGAVRAAYHSEDVTWRASALRCMGHLHGFDAEIAEAMTSSHPAERLAALQSAGQRELRELARVAARVAADPDEDADIRHAAIFALPLMDPVVALNALESLLRATDDALAEAARLALDRALGGAIIDDAYEDPVELDMVESPDEPDQT